MKLTNAHILLTASLLPLSTLLLSAQETKTTVTTTTTTTSTLSQKTQAEASARQKLVFSANQAIADGRRLLGIAKYDDAAARFQYALDAVSPVGNTAAIYNRAAAGLAKAKQGQAQALAKDGKFAQAATKLQQAIDLDPKNPEYPASLEELKKLQQVYEAQVRDPEGTLHNPAVTEDFRDRVAAVQKLLLQGDQYFKTGQYAKAEETYSKILILDPYNKTARNKMDVMEHYRERGAEARHAEYEQAALLKVNQDWTEAISTDIVVAPIKTDGPVGPTDRAKIAAKLNSIIIDKVNFDKLDISTVIQFLQDKSKELDLPTHQGINFVIRLALNTPQTPVTPPGGAPPAPGATPAPAAPTGPIHREVSITLDNVPLVELLNYITSQTNLQYTIEDYAVYLRPQIDEGETLTVRTYLVPPNFFTGGGLSVSLAPSTDPSSTTISSLTSDVVQELTSRGISFPAGATATFLRGSSKLVVRNTSDQLDQIASLIENLSKETPQITIETKLAEFNQDAIKGMAFNYFVGAGPLLGPLLPGTGGARTALRTPADLVPNSIDSLIQTPTGNVFPISQEVVTTTASNVLTVGGVLDNTGFLMVLDAINNLKGASLLSAPSVTTQNGLKANIDIVREFPYPTSFEKPKLSTTQVAYTNATDEFLQLALPPTPREFVTQDVGVSLEVKPTTYPDKRIDLDITKAQVIDFDGFIDYGVPIVAKLNQADPPTILTPGTIDQPVFNLRSVVTNLQVLDGQTAVLGGLLREDTQEINDKVPVLGDFPIIGRLFQSKVTERAKKNLLIFVTAKLIRTNGKPQYMKTLDAEVQEEKLPEPEQQIGPGVELPPLPEGRPNS